VLAGLELTFKPVNELITRKYLCLNTKPDIITLLTVTIVKCVTKFFQLMTK